jgi:hypothetical protein
MFTVHLLAAVARSSITSRLRRVCVPLDRRPKRLAKSTAGGRCSSRAETDDGREQRVRATASTRRPDEPRSGSFDSPLNLCPSIAVPYANAARENRRSIPAVLLSPSCRTIARASSRSCWWVANWAVTMIRGSVANSTVFRVKYILSIPTHLSKNYSGAGTDGFLKRRNKQLSAVIACFEGQPIS